MVVNRRLSFFLWGAKTWYNADYIPLGEYQPSDYDDMEETSGGNSKPTKVSV